MFNINFSIFSLISQENAKYGVKVCSINIYLLTYLFLYGCLLQLCWKLYIFTDAFWMLIKWMMAIGYFSKIICRHLLTCFKIHKSKISDKTNKCLSLAIHFAVQLLSGHSVVETMFSSLKTIFVIKDHSQQNNKHHY